MFKTLFSINKRFADFYHEGIFHPIIFTEQAQVTKACHPDQRAGAMENQSGGTPLVVGLPCYLDRVALIGLPLLAQSGKKKQANASLVGGFNPLEKY